MILGLLIFAELAHAILPYYPPMKPNLPEGNVPNSMPIPELNSCPINGSPYYPGQPILTSPTNLPPDPLRSRDPATGPEGPVPPNDSRPWRTLPPSSIPMRSNDRLTPTFNQSAGNRLTPNFNKRARR